MIYVYAILEGREPVRCGANGFGGEPLRRVTQGALEAVYSGDCTPGLEPTEEALWVHEQVLDELMATHTVLPLRFGSTLDGEGELRELLTARHAEFAAALRAVRGCVEIGVRASARTPPEGAEAVAAPPETGRAYLAAKLERRRTAARIGEDLHAELASFARASTFRPTTEPRPGFSGAYLVDRARVGEFRRQAAAAREARPQIALACTGPWPPFSFTEPPEEA